MDDLFESRRARDAGMAKVLAHTDEEYKERYREAWWAMLEMRCPFNNDDIVEKVGMPPGNANCLGGLFHGCLKKAYAWGWVEVCGERSMPKKSSHARVTKLYRGRK